MKIPDKVPSKLTLDKIRSANAVTQFINKQVRKKYPNLLKLRYSSYLDLEVIVYSLGRILSAIENGSIKINRDDISFDDINEVYRLTTIQADMYKKIFLDPWISNKDMAELLGKEPKTLRKWILQGYRSVGKEKILIVEGVHYKRKGIGKRNFYWNFLKYWLKNEPFNKM